MGYRSKAITYQLSRLLKRSTLLRRLYAWLFEADRSRQFALTQWMNNGITLTQSHQLHRVSFEQGEAWVTLPCGLEFRYLTEIPGAGAEPSIYRGEYEPAITALLLAQLENATTFIDIGANLGWFSLHIAQQHPNLQVHAFEPGEFAYANIKKNIARNQLQRSIQLNHLVITDHCGTEQFTNQQLGHALNHINRKKSGSTKNLREVAAITLDHYVAEQAIPLVELIKCDVEGAEMLVIEGSQAVLKRDRPKLLLEICPLWMARFGQSPMELWNRLREYGYLYRVIKDNGEQINSGDFLRDIGDGANVFFSTTLE